MTTRTVLAVGAHPDDEVLGAGGTLASHAAAGDEVHVLVVTEGASTQYDDETLIEEKEVAARRCSEVLGVRSVRFGRLPDMRLDDVPHVDVNVVIEEAVEELEPDVVYTHASHDVNRDHMAVYESTLVATRPRAGVSRVLAYETPSATEWTGGDRDQFRPGVYVDISDHLETKIEAFAAYESEQRAYPHPRSEEALRARAKTRGTEAGFAAAEAFELVREYRTDP